MWPAGHSRPRDAPVGARASEAGGGTGMDGVRGRGPTRTRCRPVQTRTGRAGKAGKRASAGCHTRLPPTLRGSLKTLDFAGPRPVFNGKRRQELLLPPQNRCRSRAGPACSARRAWTARWRRAGFLATVLGRRRSPPTSRLWVGGPGGQGGLREPASPLPRGARLPPPHGGTRGVPGRT